jgi:uncharacterized protein (DUF1697 family)
MSGARSSAEATSCVALLRGINVGKAKRIQMADLRRVFDDLGYGPARTILNSGNVVFRLPPASGSGSPSIARAGERIEGAIESELGVSSRVTVLDAAELAVVVAANPLLDVVTNNSRLMVAFLPGSEGVGSLEDLAARDWGAERLALGQRVAYMWCPDGITASPLSEAVHRALGTGLTVRNWATVLRLVEVVEG